MERRPQTFSNHAKYDPLFHFILSPLFLALVIWSARMAWNEGTALSVWRVLMAVGVFLALFKMRLYSLKVQDRLIRLEERLRLERVLPERLRGRIGELTEGQLISLRFASDGELPALVEKVLSEGLKGAQVKGLIQNWRPDYFRV